MSLLTATIVSALLIGAPEAAAEKPAAVKASKKSNEHVIEKAYQKEFAYLLAQKKMLQKRLKELETEQSRVIGQADSELEKAQIQLMGTTLAADKLEMTLRDAEDRDAATTSHADVLDTLFEQAASSMKQVGQNVERPSGEEPDYGAALSNLVSSGLVVLDQGSSVRTESSDFFLSDGTQTKGDIIWLGQVAAYGVAQGGAGALVPAGEKRLKIFGQDQSGTAKALANQSSFEQMSVFFFESLDKPIEEREKKSLVEFLQAGGVIAFVIVGLGLIGLLLVVIRAFTLWQAGANSQKMVDELSGVIQKDGVAAAHKLVKERTGVIAFVLEKVLSHLDSQDDQIEEVLSEAILHKLPVVERFGSAIIVFASVAPLLGLLGTVTGMIATFDIITEHGTGDPRMLSGGISEALITTQLGLVVAIPLLLLGNLLKSKATGLQRLMERAALRVLNLARLTSGIGGSAPADSASDNTKIANVTQQLGAV